MASKQHHEFSCGVVFLFTQPFKNKLDSYTTADMKDGAIYRALPVYRVASPERPVTPELTSLPRIHGDGSSTGTKPPGLKTLTSRTPTRHISRAGVARSRSLLPAVSQ